jgi:hypothetical protein
MTWQDITNIVILLERNSQSFKVGSHTLSAEPPPVMPEVPEAQDQQSVKQWQE